jgi:phytoene dehydrogenase-like protein
VRVVVVGGGFGGLASAARLAKLGHDVTVLERLPRLGGALVPVTAGDWSWDTTPTTLLPAVIRDLFRKSGRPVERELELVPLEVVREHVFEDASVVRLPGESRAAQLAAFDGLRPGLGQQWVDHVASYADDWEVLRRAYLEVPWTPDALPEEVADRLDSREVLHRRLKKRFRDERLRQVAAHPVVVDGHDPRNVPAWAGLVAYLEQRFGTWTVEGGMGVLADALTARLATRRVTVETGVTVEDLVVRDGRAVAVRTTGGDVDAEVVVVAVDPRTLPALAPYVARTMPAMPPVVCHVGLEGDLAEHLTSMPHETVLHGDPMLVVRTGGRAPAGGAAWTILGRGRLAEDILPALARHGIDLRQHVVERVDRSPREMVEHWGSSPHGVLWQGRATVRRRLGPTTPVAGVYAAGAHATPGGGLHFVGLSAALVAQSVGPAGDSPASR